MAFIKLDLSEYFTDMRRLSLFPVEVASHPTIGSIIKAIATMFNLASDGKDSKNIALFREDFFIHPHLPSNVLLSLTGVLILRPVGDRAVNGCQKNIRHPVVEKENDGDENDDHDDEKVEEDDDNEEDGNENDNDHDDEKEDEDYEKERLPPALQSASAPDRGKDLEVHHHESSSCFVRSGSVHTKKTKRISYSDDNSGKPPSKRMKVQEANDINDRRQQCTEMSATPRIDSKGKALDSKSSCSLGAGSRKRRDLEGSVLGKCSNRPGNKCDDISIMRECIMTNDPPVHQDALYRAPVNSSSEHHTESFGHNKAESLSGSCDSSGGRAGFLSRSRRESSEASSASESDENDSADGDVHHPTSEHRPKPVETRNFSRSRFGKSAASHCATEESGREDVGAEELNDGSMKVLGKLKSRRPRKHNKRLKRERLRLRQLVYGEDVTALSEEQLEAARQVTTALEEKYLGRGTRLASTADSEELRHKYQQELAALCDGPFDLSKFLSSDRFTEWVESHCASARYKREASSLRPNTQEGDTRCTSKQDSASSRTAGGSSAQMAGVVALVKENGRHADFSLSSQVCSGKSSGAADLSSELECFSNATSTPICDTKYSPAIPNRTFNCTVSSVQRGESVAAFNMSKFKNHVEECAKRYCSANGFQDFSLLNEASNGGILTFVHEREKVEEEKPATNISGSKIENPKRGISQLSERKETSLLPISERSRYPFRVPPAPPRFPAVSDEVKSDFFFLTCMEDAREPLVYYRSDRPLVAQEAEPVNGSDSSVLPSRLGGPVIEEHDHDCEYDNNDDAAADTPVTKACVKAQEIHGCHGNNKPSLVSRQGSQVTDAANGTQDFGQRCDAGVAARTDDEWALANGNHRCGSEQSFVLHRCDDGQKIVASNNGEESQVCIDAMASSMNGSCGGNLSVTPGETEANCSPVKNGSFHARSEPVAHDGATRGKNSIAKHNEITNFFNGRLQSSKLNVNIDEEDECMLSGSAPSCLHQSPSPCGSPVVVSASSEISVTRERREHKSTTGTNGFCPLDGGHSTASSLATHDLCNTDHNKRLVLRQGHVKLDGNSQESSVSVNDSEKDISRFESKEKVVRDDMQSAEVMRGSRGKKYKPRVHCAVGSLLQVLRSRDRSGGPDVGAAQVCGSQVGSELQPILTNPSPADEQANVNRQGTRNGVGQSENFRKEINGTLAHKCDNNRARGIRKRRNRSSTRALDDSPGGRSSLWDVPPVEPNSVETCRLQPSDGGDGRWTAPSAQPPQESSLAGLNISSLPPLTAEPRVGDVILFYENKGDTKILDVNEDSESSVLPGGHMRETPASTSVSGTNNLLTSSSEESLERLASLPVVGRVVAVTDDGDVTLNTIDVHWRSAGAAPQGEGELTAADGGNKVRCVRWRDVLRPRLVFP